MVNNTTNATLRFPVFQVDDPSPNSVREFRWNIATELFSNVKRVRLEAKPNAEPNFNLVTVNVVLSTLQGVLDALNTLGIGVFYSIEDGGDPYIVVPSDTIEFGEMDIVSPGFPVQVEYAFLYCASPIYLINTSTLSRSENGGFNGGTSPNIYIGFYCQKSDNTNPAQWKLVITSASSSFPDIIRTGTFTAATPASSIIAGIPYSVISVYGFIRLEVSDNGIDWEEVCSGDFSARQNGSVSNGYPFFKTLTYTSGTGAATVKQSLSKFYSKGGASINATLEALPYIGTLGYVAQGTLTSPARPLSQFPAQTADYTGTLLTGQTASSMQVASRVTITMPDGVTWNESQAYGANLLPLRVNPIPA